MSDPNPTFTEAHNPARANRTDERSCWSQLSAYLAGAATVLDLPGVRGGGYHPGAPLKPQEDIDVDVLALGCDWSAVGDDLRAATVRSLAELLARRSTQSPRDAAVQSAAQDLLDKITARQDRRFAVVSGTCGIGKSALLESILADRAQETYDVCLEDDFDKLVLIEAKRDALAEAAKDTIRSHFGDYLRRKQEIGLENQGPAQQNTEAVDNKLPSFRAFLSALKAAVQSRSTGDARRSKPAKSQDPVDRAAAGSPQPQKHLADVRG